MIMQIKKSSVWGVFRTELLQLMIALLGSCLLLAWAYSYAGQLDEQTTQATNEQYQTRQDIERLVENKRIVKQMKPAFLQLKAKGFYAEEDRLAWTEVLKQVSEHLKLPGFKYSISPQKRVSNVGPGFQSNLGLAESLMEIEADLLHEGDFIRIIERLAHVAPASFTVRGCSLKKEDDIVLTEIKRNVGLSCQLAWYTVKPMVSDRGAP